jgi:toxin ParE1/3/4
LAPSRTFELIVSERAHGQLETIRAYLAERNPRAATKVIGTLRSAFDRLTIRPHIGRMGAVHDTREWSIVRFPYMFVYQVSEESRSVTILAVFHTAQGERGF